MSEIGFVIYIIIFLIYIFLYYITLIDLSKNLKSLLLIESFRIFPDKIEVKKADGITKIFYKCTYHDYRKNRFIIHLIEGTDKYLIDSKLFDEVSEP